MRIEGNLESFSETSITPYAAASTLIIRSTNGNRELLSINLRTGEVVSDLNSIDEAAELFVEALRIKLVRCGCGD